MLVHPWDAEEMGACVRFRVDKVRGMFSFTSNWKCLSDYTDDEEYETNESYHDGFELFKEATNCCRIQGDLHGQIDSGIVRACD